MRILLLERGDWLLREPQNREAHDVFADKPLRLASFFPSIGAVNRALTAMANALRVGDRVLDRLGAPRAWPEVLRAS